MGFLRRREKVPEEWDVAKLKSSGARDARAVEPLIALLKDESETHSARFRAAEALGELGDRRAVEALIDVLENFREGDSVYSVGQGVRTEAAVALGKLGDPRAFDPLIEALEDDSLYVRVAAAEGLGLLGDPRAVRPLLVAKADFPLVMGSGLDRHLIGEALEGFARSGAGVDALVAALDDEEFGVRLSAEMLLKHHAGPAGERALAEHGPSQGQGETQ
jgi:hypothetical protein